MAHYDLSVKEFATRIGAKPPQVKAIERLLRILPPPAEAKEPDTVSRLLAIIESQQRVIEALTRTNNVQ